MGRRKAPQKMFCAEAVAAEVRSVVTVMPIMQMPWTPQLKRVWRRIKAQDSHSRAPTIPPGAPLSLNFVVRRAEI
jgi:hypothetical protein